MVIKLNRNDLPPWFAVYLIFMAFVVIGIVVSPSHVETGKVIQVTPDTQITYVNVLVSYSTGPYATGSYNFTVSCTGNFQFAVGQNISLNVGAEWWGLGQTASLNRTPAGCTIA